MSHALLPDSEPSNPMLFPEPLPRLLAAVSSAPPAHRIPAAVWVVLALNVSVIVFFGYRIVGLLRTPPDAPEDDDSRSRRDADPPP